MQPIEFPEANLILGKDQPEYRPPPVFLDRSDPSTPMTACFELSDEEVAEIVATRRIYNTQRTFGKLYHPILLTTRNPFTNAQNENTNGTEEAHAGPDRDNS
ncbi:hypothetical protein [Paraflavitalea sp. CAU 1676]|uniref:hypothetical protein n=1 Tax=Paraflavitalea sp. CAU 1676 TaxID=3032598 RepID=UPI0023D9AD62|nr:hypothetical protein [Paraflavitalea sp. CAU 1676]MDF2189293.1 hypothetical protein [Paraflavitalea sp. CAU 1676]